MGMLGSLGAVFSLVCRLCLAASSVKKYEVISRALRVKSRQSKWFCFVCAIFTV